MSRLDTKALKSVELILSSRLLLTEEEMFIFLEGYGEVGELLRNSYVQSDVMNENVARVFVKFITQALLIADTIEFDDDYYAVVDAIRDASTLGDVWRIIKDNSLVVSKPSYKEN